VNPGKDIMLRKLHDFSGSVVAAGNDLRSFGAALGNFLLFLRLLFFSQ
jgi:hypothetical protein